MTRHVHFVGSIGLDSAEDVFDAIGATVKDHVKRCPDGEVGVRRLWISYQWPLLRATSFLVPASDDAVPGMGLCQLKLRDGTPTQDIRFGEPGYAREARTSYQDFRAAKERGAIAASTRFQVSLPTPTAVIGAFVVPQDVPKVLPAYEAAMIREVERISSAIPHRDLALQWDVCIEMIQWDGRLPHMPPLPGMKQIFAGAFAPHQGRPSRGRARFPPLLWRHGREALHRAIEPRQVGGACKLDHKQLVTSREMAPHACARQSQRRSVLRAAGAAAASARHRALLGPRPRKRWRRWYSAAHASGESIRPRLRHRDGVRIGRARTPEMVLGIMQVHAGAARAFVG